MDRSEFENKFKSLEKQRVRQVRYFELTYDYKPEFWNTDAELDTLDFGLDIATDNGSTYGITWGGEFYQFGVTIYSHSLAQILRDPKIHDVTNSSKWNDFIGKEILETKINWSWIKEGLLGPKIYYPQELILRFSDNKSIYISALEVNDKKPKFMTDSISVIFSHDLATKYRINT